MIYQSQNEPIYCDTGIDLTGASYIEASLYTADFAELKHWSKDDLEISGTELLAPMTQEESAAFTPGKCFLELKAILSGDEYVTQWDAFPIVVGKRFDKTKMGDDT